jgi:hypothetical protein
MTSRSRCCALVASERRSRKMWSPAPSACSCACSHALSSAQLRLHVAGKVAAMAKRCKWTFCQARSRKEEGGYAQQQAACTTLSSHSRGNIQQTCTLLRAQQTIQHEAHEQLRLLLQSCGVLCCAQGRWRLCTEEAVYGEHACDGEDCRQAVKVERGEDGAAEKRLERHLHHLSPHRRDAAACTRCA